MQVLTGQYTTLYSHKLRISFTDLSSPTNNKFLDILTVPRGYTLVWFQVKQKKPFFGSGTGTITFRLHTKTSYISNANNNGMFGSWLSTLSTADQAGYFQVTPARTMPAGLSFAGAVACGSLTPTTFRITAQQGAATPLSGLIAGSFDIWLTVAKLP